MPYTYKYQRAIVTTDCVIFSKDNNSDLNVLLIRRGHEPFKDKWALPGGFIEMDETLLESAHRELREETGIKDVKLTQLYTFGNPGRDPRGRSITVAYYGFVNMHTQQIKADDDAKDAKWFPIDSLPELAFDHKEIISVALSELSHKQYSDELSQLIQ